MRRTREAAALTSTATFVGRRALEKQRSLGRCLDAVGDPCVAYYWRSNGLLAVAVGDNGRSSGLLAAARSTGTAATSFMRLNVGGRRPALWVLAVGCSSVDKGSGSPWVSQGQNSKNMGFNRI